MKALILLAAISKTYHMGDNRIEALKYIDLTLESGAFAALQGPSGSGKSTLLNLCGLLDQADTGSFQFNGRDVRELSSRQLTEFRREMIGFVFQDFNLLPVMTVFDNVAYPLLLTGTSGKKLAHTVDGILERVGLSEQRSHRPDQLSGGQRQRAAIARALVKHPCLVIADEPTANLDSHTAAQIIDLMHEMASSTAETDSSSFLIATHDERMAKRCDRVIKLHDGAIQCVG